MSIYVKQQATKYCVCHLNLTHIWIKLVCHLDFVYYMEGKQQLLHAVLYITYQQFCMETRVKFILVKKKIT